MVKNRAINIILVGGSVLGIFQKAEQGSLGQDWEGLTAHAPGRLREVINERGAPSQLCTLANWCL